MTFNTGLDLRACDAGTALTALQQAHGGTHNALLRVQSHSDYKAFNYILLKACRNITRAVTTNLEDYSDLSERAFASCPLREEVRQFIRQHQKGVERNALALKLYNDYRDMIPSNTRTIVERYVDEIRQSEQEGSVFANQCQRVLDIYK